MSEAALLAGGRVAEAAAVPPTGSGCCRVESAVALLFGDS